MFLVDDILLSPVTSVLWVFREIHAAATQEVASQPEQIAHELTELYMMLETKRISEQEFDACEKVLLERLEKMQDPASPEGNDGNTGEEKA